PGGQGFEPPQLHCTVARRQDATFHEVAPGVSELEVESLVTWRRGTCNCSLPLGVTGNTPDSGSGESWFEPRRGNFEGPPGDRRRPFFVAPRALCRLLRGRAQEGRPSCAPRPIDI